MPRDNPPRAVPDSKAVLAAGAVLWRPGDDPAVPEVAIIHRPRYDDWSLPKGKVDPGETEPVTAVREVAEETGYGASLGRRLPSHDELMTAIGEPGIALAEGGELTRNVYPSVAQPGRTEVLYITDNTGSVALTSDTAAGAKAFRCVADPLN